MARRFRRLTMLGHRFAGAQGGATAIEYSVIAAGVAGAVMLTIYALGSSVETNLYGKIIGAWQ